MSSIRLRNVTPLRLALPLAAVLIAGCGDSATAPTTVSIAAERGASSAVLASGSADTNRVDTNRVDPHSGASIATATRAADLLQPVHFESAMLDRNSAVRLSAVAGLRQKTIGELLPFLPELRRAMGDSDPAVRSAVVEVLAVLDHPKAISALLDARGDSSPIVREGAAEALYRIKRERLRSSSR